MEFDFRNMTDGDFHGIKSLISQVSHGPLSSLTTVADPICNQVNIGCVVTTGDEDSGVCAFGSVLNIRQHKDIPGILALTTLLKDIAKRSPKSTRAISNILAGPDFVVGLVLKERLINFPPELAPNIHKVLIGDIQWSCSDEYEPDADESRADYAFTTLLFLSTFEIEASSRVEDGAVEEEGQDPASLGIGHKKKRKMEKKAMVASRIYHHWEDEVFVEKALFSHTWQNSTKASVIRGNKKYSSYSILYGMKFDDYVALVDQIGSM